MDGQSVVPVDTLENDEYFSDFRLNLPEVIPGQPNRFHRRTYANLDEGHRTALDLRTIRHMIVRQVGPAGDEAMYEIFNRLNSGGITLTPQEIRRCAFDSKFYEMLYRTNTQPEWRKLVGTAVPDVHMKDVEILLRGFAMLLNESDYRPSMIKFLNSFSQGAKSFDGEYLKYLEDLLSSFLLSCQSLSPEAFHSVQGRFSPMIFESVFVATCDRPYMEERLVDGVIIPNSLEELKADLEFRGATQSQTTAQVNVRKRLNRAREVLALGI